MSGYTSGRPVKSSRLRFSTPATATREARRLVAKHLPDVPGVTIDSRLDYDLTTSTAMVRTMITFPATADASDLALAAERLIGHIRSDWTQYAITIYRTA